PIKHNRLPREIFPRLPTSPSTLWQASAPQCRPPRAGCPLPAAPPRPGPPTASPTEQSAPRPRSSSAPFPHSPARPYPRSPKFPWLTKSAPATHFWAVSSSPFGVLHSWLFVVPTSRAHCLPAPHLGGPTFTLSGGWRPAASFFVQLPRLGISVAAGGWASGCHLLRQGFIGDTWILRRP
ncbi:hypothetical protein U9M48_040703, partial [Paspalum notatum var. saurae]